MARDDQDTRLGRLVNSALRRPLPPVSIGGPAEPGRIDAEFARADLLAAVDELPPQVRFGGPKRVLMRVARLFLHRQAEFNRQATTLTRIVNHQLASHVVAVEHRISALAAAQVDLELRIDEHLEHSTRAVLELTARLDQAIVELRGRVDALTVAADARRAEEASTNPEALAADVAKRFARVDAALAGLTSSLSQRPVDPDSPSVAAPVLASIERIRAARYGLFEDRYRGSETDVRDVLSPYLDDVLARPEGGGTALDIGCGRGEWLRLLAEHDIVAQGIDMNPETVAEGVAAGLDVIEGDGIAHLATLEPGSLGVLSAFHVLEHLAVEDHDRFFEAAARALRPGGLLIVETPNPTNLVVGAAAFYRDPSHVRPIHPDYLNFLAGACGFIDTEIRFLHPRPGYEALAESAVDELDRELRWALFGPQDLALVARRPDDL